ncbi:hypothetical protein [Wenyingzhuangia sp. 2_MG-2023]|uniref:hypothetical protein n=1 Tax=Wenyingzhuangia sp. 2_MG-2023 TaxID=3062639 RepID=UPI0026E13032|nr:hypothetical protein [Wenyingzhuangia sp. 2_MG-2023]MDO6737069.1 hypothetical protein [Wenyingzhuangia sp. 2_MG-2023]
MKAVTRLFTFLICMIGFAGFGNSTPDLAINSVITVYEDDGPITVIKNVDDSLDEVVIVIGYQSQVKSTSFKVSDLMITAKEAKIKDKYVGSVYKPPLIKGLKDNDIHNNIFFAENHRKPRDGIRMV